MKTLDPDERAIYGDLLAPPIGYRFDCGLATTYSLSLSTLLTVPLRLTLFGVDDAEELLENRVALLEGLSRTADRITLFCQQGRIAGERISSLSALLEQMVHEIQLERGAFHAKIWLLRYVATEDNRESPAVLLRLGIPSRNVTADRCWDVALTLDGIPGSRTRSSNRPLVQLLSWLMEHQPKHDLARRDQVALLRDEVARTDWELPAGVDLLEFAVTGLGKKQAGWPLLPGAKRVAVISPFVRAEALSQIAADAVAGAELTLLGRAAELAGLPTSISTSKQWRSFVLHQGVFGDVSEVGTTDVAARADGDLHAKVYLADYAVGRGGSLTIVVGSANATNAALVNQSNVEIMARLTGRNGVLGRVDDVLGPEGLGRYLQAFPFPQVPVDTQASPAELALEAARDIVVAVNWRLTFATKEPNEWTPTLTAANTVILPESVTCTVRLATLPEIRAVTLNGETATTLAGCGTADATQFVAFHLSAQSAESIEVITRISDADLPDSRNAAVMRSVIGNSRAFLVYLRFLLGDLGGIGSLDDLLRMRNEGLKEPNASLSVMPLLEDIVRAAAHDPSRLVAIQRLVSQFSSADELRSIIPEGFDAFWSAIAPLIGDSHT